ncbi:MAG TPA: DUF6526 family protein [Candidatus Limnocylindrales bacterium]|nr:DUF6526 family protein [Candidatus Limnocylindrales bacterium]
MAEQNYSNHVRWVPTFHFFVMPVLLLNFAWSIDRLVRGWFTWDALIRVLTALALVVLMFHARLFALRVQDRVIRMEERQRMSRLLPDDLKPRIEEFSPVQLVALRFASDGELPDLACKVLTDKITDPKTIKQMVKQWRGDYLRA